MPVTQLVGAQVMRRGRLIGLGVGPGDPELMTVKARARRWSRRRRSRSSPRPAAPAARARSPAAYLRSGTRELIAVMPMTQDQEATGRAYGQLVTGIVSELGQGHDVVFLCEGDPLLYGSFAHLLPRLGNRFECVVIPGITSITAAAAAAQIPLGPLRRADRADPGHRRRRAPRGPAAAERPRRW